jgi:hypothetical protein
MDFSSLKSSVKSASSLEIVLFVLFTIYLILPIKTPETLAPMIDSPIGMISMFIATLYLFLYANPILGILYIFVAFELIRRSYTSGNVGKTAYIQYSPSQEKRDADLKQMNPKKSSSLEEDVVSKMAPIGHSDQSVFTDTSFKPVAENIHSAFSV